MAAVANSGRAVVTLPSDTQIEIRRQFDAPARLVYRAWTEPELVRRWWTARRGRMTVCEIDLRVGGTWRYVMITPQGMEVAFRGEYREIVPGQRIVTTEVYEPMPDAEAVDTVTFTEADGRTTLTILVDHQRREYRDGHLEAGMEDGLQDALDLVAEVVATL